MSGFGGRARRGAQAVEFVLVFPVLLLAMSGMVDYGWYFVQQHTMNSAAREAARVAATFPLDQAPATVAADRAVEYLDAQGMTAGRSVDTNVIGAEGHLRVWVTVSMPYAPLMGLLPSPRTLQSDVEMYLEQQPRPKAGGDLDGVSDVLVP